MDCKEISEKLSAYMEGQLSPEEQGKIEYHLTTCQGCRSLLHDLEKTIACAQGVEEVEPPAWLTQKVMAQVREEAGKKGILRRLFFPLHIKIPLEVFGMAAIAVLTVFVFKAIQPVTKKAEAPSESVKMREEVQKEKSSVQEEHPASREVAPQPAEPAGKSGGRMQDALPLTPEGVQDKAFRESLASDREAKNEPAVRAPASAGIVNQLRKEITFVVYVRDIITAQGEIERAVTDLGGSILEARPAPDKPVSIVTIDAGMMGDLRDRLHRIGELDVKEADYDATGYVSVTVELRERQER